VRTADRYHDKLSFDAFKAESRGNVKGIGIIEAIRGAEYVDDSGFLHYSGGEQRCGKDGIIELNFI
jgi:hypothetical protein